ncbi:MAG: NAD(P)-binding domain-containing protein, partial [Chloroflexi bacterium]|nr:NAD(P)-binding domain-containing protein [Chloroflexota bacterium]
MAEQIGFVGLGIMGKPMAKNLVNAGFAVTVYDAFSSAAMDELVAEGAAAAASSTEVAQKCDITAVMVPDGPDSEAGVLGENG